MSQRGLSKQSLVLVLVALFSLTSLMCTLAQARQNMTPLTAALNEIQGTVQTMPQGQGSYVDAENGQVIGEGTLVRTELDSRARLDLSNGTIVRIGPQTVFTLQVLQRGSSGVFTNLKLSLGDLWVILRGGSLDIDTPSGVAAVRGSFMHVSVDGASGSLKITCLEGNCSLANNAGEVKIVAGQAASAPSSEAAPVPQGMSEAEVQEWVSINPEATEVIVPLTQTSEYLPTYASPTPTLSPTGCPVPAGWVPATVRERETLETLSNAYGVPVTELVAGNCLENILVVHTGQRIVVPNVPTRTSTVTNTPLPTSTPTATVYVPQALIYTSTRTSTPTRTYTPTKTPLVYSISGAVRYHDTGVLIQSATVSLYKSGSTTRIAYYVTTSAGTYSFGNLLPGKYDLTAAASGHVLAPKTMTLLITNSNLTNQDFFHSYSAGGTVRTTSGKGISGVTVTIGGDASKSTTTSSSGAYSFTYLISGNYILNTSSATMLFAPAAISISINDTDGNITGADFVRGYYIKGTVKDITGTGVSGINVKLMQGTTQVANKLTDSSGNYVLVASVGSYSVVPELGNCVFSPADKAVTVADGVGDVTNVNFTQNTYAVGGNIKLYNDKFEANIPVNLGTYTANTDAKGDYLISNVPAGSYTLALAGGISTPVNYSLTLPGNYLGMNFIKEAEFIPAGVWSAAACANVYDVSISGGNAYVSCQGDGLKVVDLTTLTEVTTTYSTTPVNDVFIQNTRAYIASGAGGLNIVEFSPVSSPTILGNAPVGNAQAVAVSGNYAYVVDQGVGLKVIDVSTPAAPTQIATYDDTQARDLVIKDNYVYLAGGETVNVIKIETPASPTLAKPVSMTGAAIKRLMVRDNTLFLADKNKGMRILDIFSPDDSVLDATYPMDSTIIGANGVFAGDMFAFLGHDSGLQAIKITDLKNPLAYSVYGTGCAVENITMADGNLYVSCGSGGLLVLKFK